MAATSLSFGLDGAAAWQKQNYTAHPSRLCLCHSPQLLKLSATQLVHSYPQGCICCSYCHSTKTLATLFILNLDPKPNLSTTQPVKPYLVCCVFHCHRHGPVILSFSATQPVGSYPHCCIHHCHRHGAVTLSCSATQPVGFWQCCCVRHCLKVDCNFHCLNTDCMHDCLTTDCMRHCLTTGCMRHCLPTDCMRHCLNTDCKD